MRFQSTYTNMNAYYMNANSYYLNEKSWYVYRIGGLFLLHVLQLYKLFIVEQARINGTNRFTIGLYDLA